MLLYTLLEVAEQVAFAKRGIGQLQVTNCVNYLISIFTLLVSIDMVHAGVVFVNNEPDNSTNS